MKEDSSHRTPSTCSSELFRLAIIHFFQKGILSSENSTKLLRMESQYAEAFGEFKDVLLNEVHSTLKCVLVDFLLAHSCVDNWKVLHLFPLEPVDSYFHLLTDFTPVCATVGKLALNTSNVKLPIACKLKRSQVPHADLTVSFRDNNPSLTKETNNGFNVAEIVDFVDKA
mmetsp:Transcript_41093/g.63286  ORF Transcript_41093/g.63286 Transcript_41093/m.63286 type:complete len:170 (+) Transcript_41093:41-550(+)